MAVVFLYALPVILAFVLIPKPNESATVLETHTGTREPQTHPTHPPEIDPLETRSDIGKRRHGRKHRQKELSGKDKDLENIDDFKGLSSSRENDETHKNIGAGMESDDASQYKTTSYYDDVDDKDDTGDLFDTYTDFNEEDVNTEAQESTTDDDVKYNKDHVTHDSNVELSSQNSDIAGASTYSTIFTSTVTPKSTTPSSDVSQKLIDEKEIKIEMVKQHLLQKLGLTEVPKVDDPLPPLPFDFYVGEDFSMNDEAEEEEKEERRRMVKTREIFVFGEDITNKCAKKKGTGCYSFNITSSNINPDLVSSIELWIYKQPDVNDHHIQEFMVSELEPYLKDGKEVLRFRNIVKRIETRLKYGWMKIYVRRSVIRWFSKPHRNHGLAVVCKTCQRQNHKTIYGTKEGYTPILVFYMKQHARSHKRVRRDTQCIEGGNNCCHKEELEINFRDIGWNYIMTPETIRPNFCTGSCNGIQAAYYNHTRLIQQLRQSVMHDFSSIRPCCSPVSFARPQSLLYRDNFGVVRKVDVPDLIIGECGCA